MKIQNVGAIPLWLPIMPIQLAFMLFAFCLLPVLSLVEGPFAGPVLAAEAPPKVEAVRESPVRSKVEPSLAELEARYAAAQAQIREEFANLRAAQAEIARIREIGPRIEAEAAAIKAQIDALKKK